MHVRDHIYIEDQQKKNIYIFKYKYMLLKEELKTKEGEKIFRKKIKNILFFF